MRQPTTRVSAIAIDPTKHTSVCPARAAASSTIEEDMSGRLLQAQALSRRAAQWLSLIRFRSHAVAPAFSESVSHYRVLLGAASPDAERLESCRTMLVSVRRQLVVEELNANARIATERPTDPYGAEWRITERGAVLHVIADLLSEAIGSFEIALND